MDGVWRIEMLGGLRAIQGERIVSRFRSRQAGGLLAYLAFHRDRSHAREVLIEQLWPECDPAAGRNRFRVALASLRRQLEPPGVPPGAVLMADRMNLRLNPAAVVTDVAQFEAALKAGRAGGAGLEEAVELYRGELLPGYFEEWILLERQRLAEAFLQALTELTALAEQAGDLPLALQWARRAVSADPLREEAHRDVMRLLAAMGQPEAALAQYEELERRLAQELGAAPLPEIGVLARDIAAAGRRPAAGVRSEGGGAGAPSTAASLRPALSEPALYGGTVTVLAAEIERPAELRERRSEAGAVPTTEWRDRLRAMFQQGGGRVVAETGDGFVLVFAAAGHALSAALAAQRVPADAGVEAAFPPVRMALHTGDVPPPEVNGPNGVTRCAARILAAGWGGQILLSAATAGLVREELGAEVRLVDLGLYRLDRRLPESGCAAPERIFQVVHPGMARRDFPPLKAEAAYTGDLPLQFTRFFGREVELERLGALLGDTADGCRLVTLTGPGGVGKTRLALEVAARVRASFHGAVWFVPVADLTDARSVPDKILDALRLPRTPHAEPFEQLAAALSWQPALLVLDSFEHLAREGAAPVRRLLERVPTLTCLITSRQRLGLEGEQEFALAPLAVPGGQAVRRSGGQAVSPGRIEHEHDPNAQDHRSAAVPPERLNAERLTALIACPSVALFVDRAQAVRPDFQVTARNAAAVAALCARLEGLPLAIELAAARARLLTPAQILVRLERQFELLTARHREADPRHRSLWAAVDWSYQLLSPALQRLFTRLSVFRGGFTLEAAEAICGSEGRDALGLLEQLQESSLLVAEEVIGEETAERQPVVTMRYRLLESLRQYAAEQLASEERELVAQRHAAYYLALAEQAEPELLGPDQVSWLRRLEQEHENLRTALRWCLKSEEGGEKIGLRFGAALWGFWWVRGYLSEGREWLVRLLAVEADASRSRAKAHACAGLLAHFQGDHLAARQYYEESLTIGRARGDGWVTAVSLTGLGFLMQYQGEQKAARALFEESEPLWRALSDRWGLAVTLDGLGSAALERGDMRAARALYEESLRIQRERGDQWGAALSLRNLGGVARREGEIAAARACYRESLAIRARLEDRRGIAECLEGMAAVAVAAGQPERAACWFGAAQSLREETGAPLPPANRAEYDGHLAAARAALGVAFAEVWEGGLRLTPAEAVADARDWLEVTAKDEPGAVAWKSADA